MNLAMLPFNLQSSSPQICISPHTMISGVNEELHPFNRTPPVDFGSEVLRLCLYDFSSILKV